MINLKVKSSEEAPSAIAEDYADISRILQEVNTRLESILSLTEEIQGDISARHRDKRQASRCRQ